MGWAESDTDSDSEYSSDVDSSSHSSQARKRKLRCARKPRKPPRKLPEYPRNSAANRPSRVQRRHIYEHPRRRIKDKISKLSGINTAIYLYLRNLNDTECDIFVEVKTYLTEGSDYFPNNSYVTSD